MNWFVLRCVPGKELTLQEHFKARFGIETFVPVERKRQHDSHGRFIWTTHCILSSYVFVRTEKEELYGLYRNSTQCRPMSRKENGLIVPVVVPDRDMENFIRVSGNKEEKIAYYDPSKLNFKQGDKVRVIGGAFVGVEGLFMRVGAKHEKRVIIQLEGLIAVATAAIPASLVEKI